MVMTYPNGGRYVGSGVMVGPNHVLTAAHNIYSTKDGCHGWASDVEFYPGLDEGNQPFGRARGVVLLVMEDWTKTGDPQHDLGMVILDEAIGYRTGWGGLFCGSGDLLKTQEIRVTGYPGDKGGKEYRAKQMWTMSHQLTDVSSMKLFYEIDTSKGQSGSAVWGNFKGYSGYQVIGIHTHGGMSTNQGTRLSPTKIKMVHSWIKTYRLKILDHPSILVHQDEDPPKGIVRPYSLYDLAKHYDYKNPTKAISLYLKAASGGHSGAQFELGFHHQYEGKKVVADFRQAFEWYLKAANLGNPKAQNNIGIMYKCGEGVEKDEHQGCEWLLKAANQGNPIAQYNIGYGEGVEKENHQAFEWYLKAANQGIPRAQNNIGMMYKHGKGGER